MVEGGTLKRQYFMKDHLGNIRLTFDTDKNVLQEDSYYPFGMTQNGLNYVNTTLLNIEDKNKFLYNGKEKDEQTGYYEYGFRDYDSQIGRWHVRDALAEMYFHESPYVYVGNNPINKTDYMGLTKDTPYSFYPDISTGFGVKMLGMTHKYLFGGGGGGGSGGGGGGGGGGGAGASGGYTFKNGKYYNSNGLNVSFNEVFNYLQSSGSFSASYRWQNISGGHNNNKTSAKWSKEFNSFVGGDANIVSKWVKVEPQRALDVDLIKIEANFEMLVGKVNKMKVLGLGFEQGLGVGQTLFGVSINEKGKITYPVGALRLYATIGNPLGGVSYNYDIYSGNHTFKLKIGMIEFSKDRIMDIVLWDISNVFLLGYSTKGVVNFPQVYIENVKNQTEFRKQNGYCYPILP